MSAEKRRIRISVEIGYGINIPDEYEDLPENWDEMSAQERDDHLTDLAKDALYEVAGSGACVVDENDEAVE